MFCAQRESKTTLGNVLSPRENDNLAVWWQWVYVCVIKNFKHKIYSDNFIFFVQFFKAKLLRVHSDKYEIADIIVNAAVNSTWNVKLEDNIPCLCARKTNTSFTEAQNHEKKKRMFLLRYETYGTGLYLKSTVAHRI